MKIKIKALILLFVSTLMTIVSCNTNNEELSNNVANSDPNNESLSFDTITIDDKPHFLEIISKSEFDEIENNSIKNYDIDEKIDDSLLVKRDSLQLHFKLGNNSTLTLTDSSLYCDCNDYVYLDLNEKINHWLVYERGMEWYNYLLINKENGTITKLWEQPSFSPDYKSFISYSFDMEAGFSANGIQYFKIIDTQPVKIWEEQWLDFGPSSIKWENSNNILIHWENDLEDYSKYNRMVLN